MDCKSLKGVGRRPYTIGVTRKETIHVLCERAFLVVLSYHIKKLFRDINIVFAIRDFEGSFITMIRDAFIGISLCLDGDLLARTKSN
jgi:hypothetical protein